METAFLLAAAADRVVDLPEADNPPTGREPEHRFDFTRRS
jgi:hypothetical protein